MKTRILVSLTLLTLVGCAKTGSDGSAFIGTWRNVGLKDVTMEISENKGGTGLLIKENRGMSQSDDSYIGRINGSTVVVSVPFGGEIPMMMENGRINFNLGRSCKDCNFYERAK